VADVALRAMQAWPLWHWAVSGGAPGLCDAAPLCMAGSIIDGCLWPAWRLVPQTWLLCGRRGLMALSWHWGSSMVALHGVRGLRAIGFAFVWQAWRLWH